MTNLLLKSSQVPCDVRINFERSRVRADSRESELSELYCGMYDKTFWITDHEPSSDGCCSGSKDPSNQSTTAFLLESLRTITIGVESERISIDSYQQVTVVFRVSHIHRES